MDRKKVADWQKNHSSIAADKVQVWSPSGTRLIDHINKANARLLVKSGFRHVVNQQAICQYDKRERNMQTSSFSLKKWL
jgi:hypothetical protein